MNRRNPFRLLAAAMGLMAAAPSVMPPGNATARVSPASPTGQRGPAQSTAQRLNGVSRLAQMVQPVRREPHTGGTVWAGIAKRGNRRGRSRWNYQR